MKVKSLSKSLEGHVTSEMRLVAVFFGPISKRLGLSARTDAGYALSRAHLREGGIPRAYVRGYIARGGYGVSGAPT